METFLIILAIVVMTIVFSQMINGISIRTEALKKEIIKVQKILERQEAESEGFNLTLCPEETETVTDALPISAPKIIIQTKAEVIIPTSKPETIIPKPKVIPIPPIAHRRKINYERFIGENLFGKIGILILVAGIGLFVKYAIDNEWINETMRTLLGFIVGSSLLFVAERLHKNYRTFSSLLAGGAFAIFYTITAVAYHYYGLFSQPSAFIILVVTTILMSILSILYDRRELAGIALAGGFLAPFLVSSGAGSYIVLFTYILILNSGMFVLATYKKWGELPLISFILTWLCMFVYTINTPTDTTAALILLCFSTGFFLLFLFPIVIILKDTATWLNRVLLGSIALSNFIYMAFGLYFLGIYATELKLSGLLTLFIALINLGIALWLKKQQCDYKLLLSALLAIVVTFVSITIPLQLDGNYITIFWASEMVLLLYLSIRSGFRIYEFFSFALALLTIISWQMDLSLYYQGIESPATLIFINGSFATNVFTGLAFLCYALLLKKYKMSPEVDHKIYTPLNVIALSAACLFLWYAPVYEFTTHIADETIVTLLCGVYTGFYLFALSFILRRRFPTNHYLVGYIAGAGVNVMFYLKALFSEGSEWQQPLSGTLSWIYWGVIAVHIFYTARIYYLVNDYHARNARLFTNMLNLVAVIMLLSATWTLFLQSFIDHEFSTGFSICLALTGLVQMILGMRLHLRPLRIASLITFGIIFLKLLLLDLWLLPTIGKIIVFILLGVVLLFLSFMYQKLKNVLFKEDKGEK